MKKQDYVPRIPYGTRDFLPSEARLKRSIESNLAELFTLWNYDEIVTPTFEYLETLYGDRLSDSDSQAFKLLDTNNRILALRTEMTTPIARVTATRLKEMLLPIRLFYITNVFRYEQAQAGRQCEFYQAGVELIGASESEADAEVIALAIAAMRKAGLNKFKISLGQVDFINGIMCESGLNDVQQEKVKSAILQRDLVGLETFLAGSGLSKTAQEFVGSIPLLHGDDVLNSAFKMASNDLSRSALNNLSTIVDVLHKYEVADYVSFDLGLIRDFDYYTGMVFEAYTPGLGFPLCGGGRYDKMLASFGNSNPATGFALGIERILLALKRQEAVIDERKNDVYIGWSENHQAIAINEALKLRAQGFKVELALTAQTKIEAQKYAIIRKCADFIMVE